MNDLANFATAGLIITGLIILFSLIKTYANLLELSVPHFLNFALFLLLFDIFKKSSNETHILISSLFLVGVIASVLFSVNRITGS